MIIDTAPYTIRPSANNPRQLMILDPVGVILGVVEIHAHGEIGDELARLIENAPALLSTTRRYIHRLRTTMTRLSNGTPIDSLAGIISAIEGPPASEALAAPASQPPAPPVPTEGWVYFPGLSKKWHYCINDRGNRSLCGGFGALTMATAEQGKNDHPDNCKACQKKLAARLARADRRAREIEGNP